jgi:hypothetical protein
VIFAAALDPVAITARCSRGEAMAKGAEMTPFKKDVQEVYLHAAIHRTGATYSFKGPAEGPLVVHPVGEWNGSVTCGGRRSKPWR